jgi:tetratricopeptide (TPR) repeat protein
LKIVTRLVVAAALALSVSVAATQGVQAAKAPAPSPSPSGSPAPLPTATPESPDTAIPRLEAKIKADPNDKDSLQQLAGYYLQTNRPDQALGLTQRLISLGVKTAQSYYLDGIANESLGHIKEATEDFEQASNLEPTNAQVLLTLTNLYLQTNRAADAERVAKRATTFNPTDKRAFENYGLVLGQEGKFDEARTQFESAAKLDPKDPLPVVLEARAYVSQKALALAAQDFDRALTIDPKYPDALLGKASLQAANHDVKDAIPTYEQLYDAETNDQSKAAVLIQEYQLYRDEKMNDQAVAVLKRAETTFPNVAGVHVAYGDYDVSLGKDQAAAENEWKTALGPNRDNPDALQRLGELALSQNKKADALGYFKRLTEVIPGEPGAWSALGSTYAQNNQFQQAHDAYRHSFELARTPQALAGLGTADLELKNYKECGQVFNAIDRNAQPFMKANPQLLYVYAKCSQESGDKTTARDAYSRFKTYVKPGSPLAHQVDQAIASLSTAPKPAPKASSKPAPKTQSSPKPSH